MTLWARMVRNSRCIRSMTVVREENDTRTHKIFAALAEVCDAWDLAQPIWLDSNISEFRRRSGTRFYGDHFIETVDFDYMEIKITEE